MHTFTDADGKKWTIQLDTRMTRAIRSEIGVDLLNLDEKTIADLTQNDEILVDVISFICTDQIKRREMSEVDFARCIIGDVIDDASDALINELVFITRRNRRVIMKKAWEKTKAAEKKMTDHAMMILDSGIVEEKVEEAIQEMEAGIGSL